MPTEQNGTEHEEFEMTRGRSTREAALFLNVQKKTLEFWRWKGIGPRYYKTGQNKVVYRLRDLIGFQDQGLVETTAPPRKPAETEATRRRSA